MNPFQKLMNDVFKNEAFLEECVIENIKYSCIRSNIQSGISYTEAGVQEQQNFTLDLKLPMKKYPEKNNKVVFGGKKYKIAYTQTDSANCSIKIHLISLSKGIGA